MLTAIGLSQSFTLPMYMCKVFVLATVSTVHIVVAPYNVEIIGMRRYPYGSDIELNCTSEGGPQLNYSWIFSTNTIDNDTMLNINNANVMNGGDYTCNVTNEAGYDSNTTTVYSELIKLLLSKHFLELVRIKFYIFSNKHL